MKELQAELDIRRRAQEELDNLNLTLERLLAESKAEIGATRDEMREDALRHAEERKELRQLKESLTGLNAILNGQARSIENLTRELDSLTYAISHDLRAPIRHLVGFSSALVEDYGDQLDATARTFLDAIARASSKVECQVEGLLKLSRIGRQDLNLAQVDLSRLVRESARFLRESQPERRAQFTIAETAVVRADAVLLRSAVENLLENAWKFTGTREIAEIEFGWSHQGDNLVYYLRDNGVGFDMRYADRLFGAFQRLHREGEFPGVGIGLAAVQRIIHRHGGEIWADAAVDGGATFYFTLAT